MLTSHFAINRLGLLIKIYIESSWKITALIMSIIFGSLFLVGFLLDTYVSDSIIVYSHRGNYISTLILGGIILSSLSVRVFGHGLRRYQYLTLPASTFEKFLCVWLMTFVAWVVLFTLLYLCYTWLVNMVGGMLFLSVSFETFELFSWSILQTISYYLVVHSVFMLGAVCFKNYAFAKTLLSLLLFTLLFGVCAVVIMKDTFLSEHYCEAGKCELFDEVWVNPVWSILVAIFWWILAPLSWILSFLSLKEQEV